jgi:hypothetical protein
MRPTRDRPVTAGRRTLARRVVTGGSAMALGGAGLLAGSMAPAAADHGEASPTGVLYTHNWRLCEIVPAPPVVTDTAKALWNNDPDVNIVETCQDPNILMWSEPMDESFFGATVCVGTTGSGDCFQDWVWLNETMIETSSDPLWQHKKTACHELGHVGGLDHQFTNDSCLTQGYAPPIMPIPDAHDYEAIDDTYPR